MSSAVVEITLLWHIEAEFYNIRVPKGMKTISQSTMRMRHKIYNCEGVNWNYHVVLSLNSEVYEEKKKKGIDSTILRGYLTKIKKIFPEEKHFWKYEEGRKSERPHFHLLFELKDVDKKKKELEKVMGVNDMKEVIRVQKGYEMNKEKSDNDIIMGYSMYRLWDKGIVYAREITSMEELIEQVEKDVAKRTGTEGFKPNKRKYGFSRGIKTKKVKKKSEYEWLGNVSVEEAEKSLESTKENFIKYFTEKRDYSGEIVYARTINDLMEMKKGIKKQVKLKV
ncbi:MAG: hypothetical protein EU529_05855 [Promethearchaeota archaeon]|nr:MAG: hypothetical protein EU529_05855 [Candidatus Lokiarchaeota archaeon]